MGYSPSSSDPRPCPSSRQPVARPCEMTVAARWLHKLRRNFLDMAGRLGTYGMHSKKTPDFGRGVSIDFHRETDMRPTRKLIAAAVASAVLSITTTATVADTPPDTLIQAWQIDDIISLDPAEVFEFTASELLGNSYQPLVGYNINDVSDVFGVIAESWEVSEDGKTFSFVIRPDMKFASGNPITAEDAVFSLQRA